MKGFSSTAKPMTMLTGKDVKFVWSEACAKIFAKLKKQLTQTPILVLLRPGVPYIVCLFRYLGLLFKPEICC